MITAVIPPCPRCRSNRLVSSANRLVDGIHQWYCDAHNPSGYAFLQSVMKITQAHADYWTARNCPKFLAHLFEPRGSGMMQVKPVNVHTLINSQLKKNPMREGLYIANTLVLVAANRRRGTMIEFMERVASRPGDHNKHDVYCRRWLMRMGRISKSRGRLMQHHRP